MHLHIDDSSFFIELERRLQEMADGSNYPIVSSRDFNQVLDNILDSVISPCYK